MRQLFWMLLFLNVLAFGAIQYGESTPVAAASSVQREIEPHRIALLDPDEPFRPHHQEQTARDDDVLPGAAALAVVVQTVPEPLDEAATPAVTSAPRASRCLEWGIFDAADALRATELLAPLGLGVVQRQVPVRHWVFVPPLTSRTEAQRKLTELNAAGVRDLYIVGTNAISLGVYSSEEAARRRLADLAGQGVNAAIHAPLDVPKSAFEIRNVSDDTEARIAAWTDDFPESSLRAIDCGTRLATIASDT